MNKTQIYNCIQSTKLYININDTFIIQNVKNYTNHKTEIYNSKRKTP